MLITPMHIGPSGNYKLYHFCLSPDDALHMIDMAKAPAPTLTIF